MDLIDALPFYVMLVDADHHILLANKAVQQDLGLDPQHVVGRYCPKAVHGLDEPFPGCPLEEAVAKGQAVERELFDPPSGRWVRSAIYPTGHQTQNGREIFVHMIHDITERVQAKEALQQHAEQLQALSRRLVEIQESERRRIARELHDEIGQSLTGLKLILDMTDRLPPDAVSASLGEARTIVNELVVQVRNMSLDLRPAMLDDLGLLHTLLWHFKRYTAQTRIDVTFRRSGVEGRRFAPQAETAVYRIVQEALTNVARHAGVSDVTVRLWADGDVLGVQVEDRGVGFDPDVVPVGASTGLSGMRERVALLGGQLTVESARRVGTRLTAELPLREEGERKEERKDIHDDHCAGG
jgi:PAS domain S-box-containing protein